MDLNSTDFAWAVDLLVVVLIVVSAYLAMVRGVFRELFSLLSWVVAFIAAFAFAPSARPLVLDIPGVGGFLKDCQLSMIASFLFVFGIALLISSILLWLFTGRRDGHSVIDLADQIGGFIFGALRGLVLVSVIYIVYELVVPATDQYAFIENAATIDVLRQSADMVRAFAPDEVPGWLENRIDQLIGACGPSGA